MCGTRPTGYVKKTSRNAALAAHPRSKWKHQLSLRGRVLLSVVWRHFGTKGGSRLLLPFRRLWWISAGLDIAGGDGLFSTFWLRRAVRDLQAGGSSPSHHSCSVVARGAEGEKAHIAGEWHGSHPVEEEEEGCCNEGMKNEPPEQLDHHQLAEGWGQAVGRDQRGGLVQIMETVRMTGVTSNYRFRCSGHGFFSASHFGSGSPQPSPCSSLWLFLNSSSLLSPPFLVYLLFYGASGR